MIRFIIPTLAQFRYLRSLRTKERAEALLAQKRSSQAANCNLNTEAALEQEERPISPASRSSDESTAVSKSKDRNREIATISHPSTKPVSQVEIPAFERIGESELRDLDHSLSDLDDTPTAAMHASDNGKVEIDGCDDQSQSQATTWSEPAEKDESMPLDVRAKRPLQTMESAGQRKKSRTPENPPTSGETAGLEEEEEAAKNSPILLHQDEEDSNKTTSRNSKPRPNLTSPVASKTFLLPIDPLSSPDESVSPLQAVKRIKRPWFGKCRKRKLQQTSLNFGTG
jgi:hypothetical protein